MIDGVRTTQIGRRFLFIAAGSALFLSAVPSFGQPSPQLYPWRQRIIGARAASLGDALGADLYDIESMYSNPAGLSFLRNSSILVDNLNDWQDKVYSANAALPLYTGHLQAVGLGLGIMRSGSIAHGARPGFVEYDIDLGYSTRILSVTPDVSVGVLGIFRMGKEDGATLRAAQFSVGIIYSPSAATSYSLVYKGLGTAIGYPVATPPGVPAMGSRLVDLPAAIEIGSTMRFPSADRVPDLSISVSGEKEYPSGTLRLKGGIEIILWNVLSLRGGYVNADPRQVRCGAGLAFGRFSVDYGLMPRQPSGRFDEFTLKMSL